MRINSENIEAFLLDFSEGNLNPEQIDELRAFVILHPEYQEMLELADSLPVLEADAASFDARSELRRYSFASADEVFVKEIEGELSESEKKELEDLLKHFPHLNKERGRFALTVLQPEQIIYPDKEQLKRRTGVIVTLYPHVLRIAALFLLTLLTGTIIYYQLNKNEGQENITVEKHENGKQNTIENITPQQATPTPVISKQTSENKVMLTDNLLPGRSEKGKVNAVNKVALKTASMQQLQPIAAYVKEKEPVKMLLMSQPALLSQHQPVATTATVDSEDYMDLYQLASKFISKATKGKVGFNHTRNDHSVLTELAVNTGDFEFVRKKTKEAVTND